MPRVEYPQEIENAYARAILADIAGLWAITEKTILPVLLALDGVRTDAPVGIDAILKRASKEAKKKSRAYSIAELFAVRTIDDAASTWKKLARQMLAIDVFEAPGKQEMLATFATNNVQLIRSVHERYFDDIGSLASEAVKTGMHARQVTALVRERFGVAQWNAERIARDQVGKLNAEATRANHESLGIRRYRWQTAGDGRVRDEHAALNGRIFSYDDPPPAGTNGEPANPGEPIMCRCQAIPIFDGFDD